MGERHVPIREIPIMRTVGKAVIPFILLFALYVQFHGDFGPGGGFQAGVIFAAGMILYALIFGVEALKRVLPKRGIEIGIAFGVLLYAGTGLLSFFKGMNFLDYDALAHDPLHGQHYGILLVELGVGLTVTCVMIAIFYAFTERDLRERE